MLCLMELDSPSLNSSEFLRVMDVGKDCFNSCVLAGDVTGRSLGW